VTRGFAQTPEADALVERTARHFAHKVHVSKEAGVTRVETRFGTVELDPGATGIELSLAPLEDGGAAELRRVAETHLQRFAREPLVIEWR
jgi:hypothetical protein